jgi:hypothetical protein
MGVLLIVINVLPIILLVVYTVEIYRFGPYHKLVAGQQKGTAGGGGAQKPAVGPLATSDDQQTQITVKRPYLSLRSVAGKAVTHDKVVKLKSLSAVHREAHVVKTRLRRSNSSKRVQERLAARMANRGKVSGHPLAMLKGGEKNKKVVPIQISPMNQAPPHIPARQQKVKKQNEPHR